MSGVIRILHGLSQLGLIILIQHIQPKLRKLLYHSGNQLLNLVDVGCLQSRHLRCYIIGELLYLPIEHIVLLAELLQHCRLVPVQCVLNGFDELVGHITLFLHYLYLGVEEGYVPLVQILQLLYQLLLFGHQRTPDHLELFGDEALVSGS